jgi:hypothetical protein
MGTKIELPPVGGQCSFTTIKEYAEDRDLDVSGAGEDKYGEGPDEVIVVSDPNAEPKVFVWSGHAQGSVYKRVY